jgi:hypothetical protein
VFEIVAIELVFRFMEVFLIVVVIFTDIELRVIKESTQHVKRTAHEVILEKGLGREG